MARPKNPYCECGNVKERPGDGCDSCRAMAFSAHSSGKPIPHVRKEEAPNDTTLLLGRVQDFVHIRAFSGRVYQRHPDDYNERQTTGWLDQILEWEPPEPSQ